MFAKGKRTTKRQRRLSDRIWLYLLACTGFGFLFLWVPVSGRACLPLFGLGYKDIVWLQVEIVQLSLPAVMSDWRKTWGRGVPTHQRPLRFFLGKNFPCSQIPCGCSPLV